MPVGTVNKQNVHHVILTEHYGMSMKMREKCFLRKQTRKSLANIHCIKTTDCPSLYKKHGLHFSKVYASLPQDSSISSPSHRRGSSRP